MESFQNITNFVESYDQFEPKMGKTAINYDELTHLLQKSITHLKSLPNVITLTNDEFIAIGDLHGTYISLLHILPPTLDLTKTYVFLGDYVDRGFFSTEILFVLLTLLLQHPKNVILLRGNHETQQMSSQNGFFLELFIKFVDPNFSNCEQLNTLYNLFLDLFNALPLVCETLNFTLLHAGIAQIPLAEISELNRFREPGTDTTDMRQNDPISDILWSDFDQNQADLYVENTARGVSIVYNQVAIERFTPGKTLIRSHTCVSKALVVGNFVNIFSSCNYAGKNKGSYYDAKPVSFSVSQKWDMDNSAVFQSYTVSSNQECVIGMLSGSLEVEFNEEFCYLVCADGEYRVSGDRQMAVIEALSNYYMDEGISSLEVLSMLENPEKVCEIDCESFEKRGWIIPRIFNRKLSVAQVDKIVKDWELELEGCQQ